MLGHDGSRAVVCLACLVLVPRDGSWHTSYSCASCVPHFDGWIDGLIFSLFSSSSRSVTISCIFSVSGVLCF